MQLEEEKAAEEKRKDAERTREEQRKQQEDMLKIMRESIDAVVQKAQCVNMAAASSPATAR